MTRSHTDQSRGTPPLLLEERHRSLIGVVANAFAKVSQWPLFPHVEAALDHDYGVSFDYAVADLPPGLVWSPAGYGPQAEVRAAVAALAAVGAATEDLERYVAVVRQAAAAEREYLPGPLEQPDLRINAEDVMSSTGTRADDSALRRLLALINSEYVLSFSGAREGEWWLAVDSRVRRYRDVAGIDDYIARRPQAPTRHLAGARVVPPPSIFIVMPFGPAWSRNVHDIKLGAL